MSDIYQLLYDYYVHPKLEGLESAQGNVLEQLSVRLSLSNRERRGMVDIIENLRLQWGTESFAIGVRFGMELTAPSTLEEDCSRLLNFLPQLDDPVS